MPSEEKKQTHSYEGFPNLTSVIAHIKARRSDQPAEKTALLDKWLQQLETIDSEMRHLEKIERFSQAIRHNNSHDNT